MYKLSVSELNEQIKSLLESSFERVLVEGELSRITFHNSGHVYFTLKDKSSSVSCVMFKMNAQKLKFRLEEGMKVVLDGSISLYKPRGSYQINVFKVEPSGEGALALAYEQLKQKLSQKGYFSLENKKNIPKYPNKIAFITSITGAALQDILKIIDKRYKNIEIDIYDVLVQGEKASFEIVKAIKHSDIKGYDIIVLARGGGSIEDLWTFNEEKVADAIYFAKTPIVSAIGHEIDWLISDFVADLRAPTPSSAIEMILPDTKELLLHLDSLYDKFEQYIEQKIYNSNQEINHLKKLYTQNSIEKKLQYKIENIENLKLQFNQHIDIKIKTFQNNLDNLTLVYPQTINSKLNSFENKIKTLQTMLKSNNPKYKSKKGFAQIVSKDKMIDIDSLSIGDIFEVQSDKIVLKAKVLEKKEIK